MSNTGDSVATGMTDAAEAIQFIPVIGQIGGAILAIGAKIASVFGADHAKAIAKEANTLNASTPSFLNACIGVMNQLSAGEIDSSAAILGLQAAQSSYYSSVAGIIKKGGTCTSSVNGLDAGTKDKYNCAISRDPCNAACCLGCDNIEPVVRHLTAIINAGGGTYTIPATTANGKIAATPAYTVTYTAPSALTMIDRKLLAALHLSDTATGGSSTIGNLELGAIVAVVGLVLLAAYLIPRVK